MTSNRCVCGAEWNRKSRPVVQQDGTLKEMVGDIFKPRRVASPSLEGKWRAMYYRAKNRGATFRAAFALFAKENNWGWPDMNWRLMPTNEWDMWLSVNDVPTERLTRT